MTFRKCKRPSSVNFVDSFPPRGSREEADNFCLIVRKHDEARGRLDVRKGEGMQRNIRKDGGRGEFSP